MKPINIFLADDNSDDCLLFKEALQELPIATELTTLHNGKQLMQLLLDPTNPLPDVVFLDLALPRKNGFECLSEIKEHAVLKQLPVIIYTSSLMPMYIEMIYNLGASYYLHKPQSVPRLKQKINFVLKQVALGITVQPAKEDFLLSTDTVFLEGEEREDNIARILPFKKGEPRETDQEKRRLLMPPPPARNGLSGN